ncbi:hypothetical protein HMPREF2946_03280 [Actinomyces sp. HMSC062G12]|nr:hypothetical protein HMPREF2946_03280 [Actinomyces sp. HMSC062G12]
MRLWFESRFERLEAGQADIRADFAELRRDLFHESGSREVADYTFYGLLDRRLRRLEAKFPELAHSQTT